MPIYVFISQKGFFLTRSRRYVCITRRYSFDEPSYGRCTWTFSSARKKPPHQPSSRTNLQSSLCWCNDKIHWLIAGFGIFVGRCCRFYCGRPRGFFQERNAVGEDFCGLVCDIYCKSFLSTEYEQTSNISSCRKSPSPTSVDSLSNSNENDITPVKKSNCWIKSTVHINRYLNFTQCRSQFVWTLTQISN